MVLFWQREFNCKQVTFSTDMERLARCDVVNIQLGSMGEQSKIKSQLQKN